MRSYSPMWKSSSGAVPPRVFRTWLRSSASACWRAPTRRPLVEWGGLGVLGCKQLAGHVFERFELERISCGIKKEHRGLFTGLTFESGVGLEDKGYALPFDSLRERLPISHLQNNSAMGNGNALPVDGVVMRCQLAGLAERGVYVTDKLVAE